MQVISYLHEVKDIQGAHMIVAPKQLIQIWMQNIDSIFPKFQTVKSLSSHLDNFDICVAGYQTFVSLINSLDQLVLSYRGPHSFN